MKKIGIMTFSSADSFGALMQCYALKTVVSRLGYDAQVIHYWPRYIRREYKTMFSRREFTAGVKTGLRQLWRSVIFIRFKNLPKALRKKREMNRFRQQYFSLTRRARTPAGLCRLAAFDGYIAGSDQIWNPEITGGALDESFFLTFAPKPAAKVAYAASTGKPPEAKYSDDFRRLLSKFDGISVREQSGRDVLQPLVERDIFVAADPTLLLSRSEWDTLAAPAKNTEPYILFFSLYFTPEQFDYVNRLSDETQLPIKHYFYGRLAKRLHRDDGSFFFDGPQEMLALIRDAKYVVTDSFHYTVFSILYQKEFFTFPSSKWNHRMEELLQNLGLEDRLIHDKSTGPDGIPARDDKDIEKRLEPIRQQSLSFLKNALNRKEGNA